MSTHSIGFDEELTKIIFQLSSNIIKYAPYQFFCNVYSGSFLIIAIRIIIYFLKEFCFQSKDS